MNNAVRWVLITIMTVAVMVSVLGGATVAMAAEVAVEEIATDGECPQQVGSGVICTGPTVPSNIPSNEPTDTELDGSELEFQLGEPLKVADADEGDNPECPIPVGNGVICTGPTVPGGTPVDGQSVTFDNWVFLPVIRS